MSGNHSQISELYSAYAAGRLSTAFRLLVQTQMALRADVRRDIEQAEAISGAFFEAEERETLSPNAFETALKRIDALDEGTADQLHAAHLANERLTELMRLPEPLREKALEACAQSGWRRLTSGVSRLEISNQGTTHSHLYRIKPGASVPQHTHHGDELTLVLEGGFTDETGSYGPGDISLQTSQDTHQPVADDDGICLVYAVSDGGMKFKGALGVFQSLFGGGRGRAN
ncbi:ChrR family anti-sigma-E factor [Henriciella litoralis]|uniref:ChrR family anti-sigma-E factor n=1 Tax=Henriciella litoralis TaxID=568102 RepID=UPI00146EC303|nr:ChrR family anti-sigma-E factor [Henriciella litoralis]